MEADPGHYDSNNDNQSKDIASIVSALLSVVVAINYTYPRQSYKKNCN